VGEILKSRIVRPSNSPIPAQFFWSRKKMGIGDFVWTIEPLQEVLV